MLNIDPARVEAVTQYLSQQLKKEVRGHSPEGIAEVEFRIHPDQLIRIDPGRFEDHEDPADIVSDPALVKIRQGDSFLITAVGVLDYS